MAYCVEFAVKQGDNGKVMTGTLRDSLKRPIDLTGETVKLRIRLDDNTLIADNENMTVHPDQVTEATRGQVSFTFLSSHTSHPVGSYKMEINRYDTNMLIKSPNNADDIYGTFHIRASL